MIFLLNLTFVDADFITINETASNGGTGQVSSGCCTTINTTFNINGINTYLTYFRIANGGDTKNYTVTIFKNDIPVFSRSNITSSVTGIADINIAKEEYSSLFNSFDVMKLQVKEVDGEAWFQNVNFPISFNGTLFSFNITSSNGIGITDSQSLLYTFTGDIPNNTTFENVNVNNNLTVGNNISASRGFFTNLGSSISRIVKGWFTDIDISGTANLTGPIYIQNASCSSGQVLTTNANGLVSCTGVVDVKSGSVSVTEGTCTSITFSIPFLSTPVATGNVQDGAENNVITISSLSTTGFDLCMEKVKIGSGVRSSTYTVYWIATNSGNS